MVDEWPRRAWMSASPQTSPHQFLDVGDALLVQELRHLRGELGVMAWHVPRPLAGGDLTAAAQAADALCGSRSSSSAPQSAPDAEPAQQVALGDVGRRALDIARIAGLDRALDGLDVPGASGSSVEQPADSHLSSISSSARLNMLRMPTGVPKPPWPRLPVAPGQHAPDVPQLGLALDRLAGC